MTAEIAILNRSALALAADSAVTISVGNKRKVYDTAEKLFELTRAQPIALMIYNNVEYVGVPLDVLIRKFRTEKTVGRVFKTIEEISEEFLAYMQEFCHDPIEEKKYLYSLLITRLRRIHNRFGTRLASLLSDALRDLQENQEKAKDFPQPSELMTALIQEEVELEKARPLPGYLPKISLRQFNARFGEVAERAIRDSAGTVEVTPEMILAGKNLGLRLIKSRRKSSLTTGLVFGGFAEEDMFPTLRYIEIDGVFFNCLKVLSTKEVDIDRMNIRAEVVPFAQKEMVERFVYGLDSELEGDVTKFVEEALDGVFSAIDGDEQAQKAAVSVRKKINKRFSEMMSNLKQNSRHDLLDIVYFMSKKELADIAYALVELTSHKRRFSTDEQTVGGPIDVAILTKSEGLVWIKRKHYFGPDVNQGYLSRVYGQVGGKDGGEEAKGA